VVSFKPRHFTPGETAHGTPRVGGWLGHRTELDAVARFTAPCRELNPGLGARRLFATLSELFRG